jgi:BCD family chlorophyll transporter-like MFS transporter
VPAALIALHYLVQLLRPRVGFGADRGGRCTPWIIGGVALLAAGGLVAAMATALMGTQRAAGIGLALAGYVAIGAGVGMAGTSNLALLAKRIAPQRRALAATVMWVMMIAGFGVSAGLAGQALQPYSPARLVQVYAVVAVLAVLVATFAVWGVEGDGRAAAAATPRRAASGSFGAALRQLWSEPQARRFTLFLFLSMLAFSAQELLVESFAGLVFGLQPGRSAQLAGLEHGGVLCGMISVALLGARFGGGSLRGWMMAGTGASAVAIALLGLIGLLQAASLLPWAVFVLGLANGSFAVAALGTMMELSVAGGRGSEGLRMGLWGAAQALAFALGGLCAGGAVDAARQLWHSAGAAYAVVFGLAALLFFVAAFNARRLTPVVTHGQH